ncbi:MAG: hypothetical protein LRY54_01680, partial [Alphaproteobacteria bacterium]|nr:hypothetical protein [Alphaproteobacteria bacterium]
MKIKYPNSQKFIDILYGQAHLISNADCRNMENKKPLGSQLKQTRGFKRMSNFTKSIMYSGIVLVAGLIAVFSIYENMDASKEAQLGAITPAAGEESVVEPEAAADTMTTDGAEEAAPAAEGEAAAPA